MILLLITLCLIFVMACLFFIVWLIAYPIYRKCIGEPVFAGSNYALGLCLTAVVINVCNLFIQIITRM